MLLIDCLKLNTFLPYFVTVPSGFHNFPSTDESYDNPPFFFFFVVRLLLYHTSLPERKILGTSSNFKLYARHI